MAEVGRAVPPADGRPRIVVDTRTHFQTITGWEATAQAGQSDSPAFARYRDDLLTRAVRDLGLTRLRVEIRSGAEHRPDVWAEHRAGRLSEEAYRPLRYATVNDNDDPFTIDPSGFSFSELDDTIEQVVLPMKRTLEAEGGRLSLNVCYVAFAGPRARGQRDDHTNPEEYAEFVLAAYLHLRDRFHLEPDAWEMILEPDNTPFWTGATIRAAMEATARRLTGHGFTPRFIAPSTTNMRHALEYVEDLVRGGVPPGLVELSYHRYAGTGHDVLIALARRAAALGLRTSMLEHIASGYEDLHEDLSVGNTSAWQQFTLAYPSEDDGGHYFIVDARDPDRPRVSMGRRTTFLRQYFRYVRPGAVRVSATTSDPRFDPLAFVNTGGEAVVVVKAAAAGTFAVQGLPRGRYDVSYTTDADTGVSRGVTRASADGRLILQIPASGVLTASGVAHP